MASSTSPKRSWLAAALAAIVPGLGHCYLRRWRRAIGWLVVFVGVSSLFVAPETMEALANWEPVDPLAVAPLAIVGTLSVLDAFLLALVENAVAQVSAEGPVATCPHCGKDLDPELAFCQWCSEPLPGADQVTAGSRNDDRT